MYNIKFRAHKEPAALWHFPKSIFQTRIYLCSGKNPFRIIPAILLLAGSPSHVNAVDSFQEKMLFEPPESMLRAEARGRIMIYDGLESTTVNRAMDEQFDRIDNMMFTRIRHVQENGEVEFVDDGCD